MRKESFRKSERLRDGIDFSSILRNSHPVRAEGLALYFRRSCRDVSRIGIIISKKVLKHAVDRNRARRLVREFFRKNKDRLSGSFDLVVKFTGDRNIFMSNRLYTVLEEIFWKAELLSC